jgi:hypothetical protein
MMAMVASSTSRMISAAPMPSLRARSRGSLLVRIEMKTRLSIPSTTSIAMSVTIAAHPSGSGKAISPLERLERERAARRGDQEAAGATPRTMSVDRKLGRHSSLTSAA